MVVDSIFVYGLLVAHNKQGTIILKYFVNFKTDSYVTQVGEQGSFEKLFSFVVFIGLLGAKPMCD